MPCRSSGQLYVSATAQPHPRRHRNNLQVTWGLIGALPGLIRAAYTWMLLNYCPLQQYFGLIDFVINKSKHLNLISADPNTSCLLLCWCVPCCCAHHSDSLRHDAAASLFPHNNQQLGHGENQTLGRRTTNELGKILSDNFQRQVF